MVDLVVLIIFDYWREKSPSDNRERRLNIQDRAVYFRKLRAESKFWAPEGWREGSSLLWTRIPGMTCELHLIWPFLLRARQLIPSSPRILKPGGRGSGVKGVGKRRRRVWGEYLFYGTKCQWKIPVPNTSAAITLGAGTVTVMLLINAFAQIVVAESYIHHANTHPILSTFLHYLPSL